MPFRGQSLFLCFVLLAFFSFFFFILSASGLRLLIPFFDKHFHTKIFIVDFNLMYFILFITLKSRNEPDSPIKMDQDDSRS